MQNVEYSSFCHVLEILITATFWPKHNSQSNTNSNSSQRLNVTFDASQNCVFSQKNSTSKIPKHLKFTRRNPILCVKRNIMAASWVCEIAAQRNVQQKCNESEPTILDGRSTPFWGELHPDWCEDEFNIWHLAQVRNERNDLQISHISHQSSFSRSNDGFTPNWSWQWGRHATPPTRRTHPETFEKPHQKSLSTQVRAFTSPKGARKYCPILFWPNLNLVSDLSSCSSGFPCGLLAV